MLRNKTVHRIGYGTARTVARMASWFPFLDRLLGRIGWLLILAYRNFISPFKGFRCAHAAVASGPSCSEVGLREFRAHRLSVAMAALDLQLQRCKESHAMAMNRDLADLIGLGNEIPPLLVDEIVCCDLS